MKSWTAWAILAAVALASCAGPSQVAPTVVVEIPTSRAGPTAPPSTAVPATPTPPAAEPTPAAVPQTAGVPAVVLGQLDAEPAEFTVVDPVTGSRQAAFTVPEFREGRGQWVGGQYLFYLNDALRLVRRAGFDGSLLELPFVNPDGRIFEGEFLPSPDGARIAWGTSVFDAAGGNDTHIQLAWAHVDGSGGRTLVDQRLRDQSILPLPVQWSADGRHLYYTNLPYGIGGYILFAGGPDLQQVDLTTGEVTPILPDMGCLCAMSISADGATLAYISGFDPLELALRDLATGSERRAALEEGHLQAGSILWSPDGDALMYTMAISNFDQPENEAYSVVRVDRATLAQTVLIRDDRRLPETAAWPVASTVWLNGLGGTVWRMDAVTGALTQVAEGQRVMGVAR